MSDPDMPPIRLGQRIADPRALSDELGTADDTDAAHPDMYSGLAHYTFGSPRTASLSSLDAPSGQTEFISPLSPAVRRLSPDRTPRPSVSGQSASPPFQNVCSHPSQGAVRSASSRYSISSYPRCLPVTRDPSHSTAAIPSGSTSRDVSGSDSERSQDPAPHTDPIIFFSSQRGKVMPDNASQHTFGPASRTYGTAASSQDHPTPSSSSVSVTTSRSSSRASMHTMEQFSSDDEFEIDYYDGSSSPVTFARDYLVDIDEDIDLVDPRPSSVRISLFDGRRGSLPMAIPGAVQPVDAYSTRSREGSILTLRRPSRSWDDANIHLSLQSGQDPSVILPKSEPLSRADWLSVEAQLQAKQQQAAEASVYDGLDLQYILSKRSEGSIRSFNSRLSFVQGAAGPRRSSPYLPVIAGPASSSVLPFEDSFMNHIQKHDRAFDALRYYWSFQREKADASSSSLRRRQQVNHYRTEKPGKEIPSRVQEMWRCGHVGRFKVDRLLVKPQSADPSKGAQQRIHIRHIPDPFLMGNTTTGPHSVIHKHSRAVAFSIFRSHGLFSGRQVGGVGLFNARTHINMRFAIMLAPKKVQEQYTSTKTVRQLSTHGLLDNESRGLRDRDKGSRRGAQNLSFRERDSHSTEKRRGQEKEDKSKVKSKGPGKGKGKDKPDKKRHRGNPTESTESSTATSSAGSVSNSALQQVISLPERLVMQIQLSPSVSSSTTVYGHDSVSRPGSPTSSLPPSVSDSTKPPENEPILNPAVRHHRDHRDSIDSDDRLATRTTHAEAFSALDPNDIENLRAKANSRANVDSGSTFAERLFRRFRSGARVDDHSSSGTQPRAFEPPWLTTTARDQQEENDRILNDLNAAFRDVGLLHSNPHKPSRVASKRKSDQGVLDRVPDDSLYMLLPLWPGETDTASVHAETSSTTSFVTVPENRQYLLVYYVPFGEAKPKDKKPEKKKAKQSYSSDSGVEVDARNIHLSAFRAVALVVTYDELRLTGVRVPSDGLAINGPEWEAINYPASTPLRDVQMTDTVVCQCLGRERGFDFLEHGLLKLGLCTREEFPIQDFSESEEDEREGKTMLTPIGRAAVEMIWLGCLAITSFGPT